MQNKPTPRVQTKPKPARSRPEPLAALQSGQIWKAGETFVHIKEAGARLVHYKMATALHRPGLRRHLSSVKTVRAFLRARRAQLLTDLSSKGAVT